MLVVHLITELGRGGAEGQLRDLIRHRQSPAIQHVVISIQKGGAIKSELEAAGAEVFSLDVNPRLPSPLGLLRLVRLLLQLSPEVLHCWMYHGCLAGAIASTFVKIPRMVWGLHSANPALSNYKLATRLVVGACARRSSVPDVIVVVSDRCRDAHLRLGFKSEPMVVIPNGVDAESFRPDSLIRQAVRKELGLSPGCTLIGLFARFHPVKDHVTFLRSAKLLRQTCPDAHFLLAGDGIDKNNGWLAEVVREQNLEGAVNLVGPRSDIPRLTAALDVSCLSSRHESFGIVALEAMACEVPCVVTDVGDLAKIVEGTGKVVPPGDAQAFAHAMADLLALTPLERAKIGREARKRVLAEFTIQRTVAAYDSIYGQDGPETAVRVKHEPDGALLSSRNRVQDQ